MNSLRVSSSQLTSVRRKLLTKPLIWLRGKRSSCAVAARTCSAEGGPKSEELGAEAAGRRGEPDRRPSSLVGEYVPAPARGQRPYPISSLSFPSSGADRRIASNGGVMRFANKN
jgi:hypothetical protein